MSDTLRPGGLALTKRMLELITPTYGSRILDVGCGGGATVSLLRERGFVAFGVDIELPADALPELLCADATSLPFPDGDMDAVLFECSLSKIETPEVALCEARRVLKSGGKLMVSDLFTLYKSQNFSGLLGRLEPWHNIMRRTEAQGFALCNFEEHGDALSQFWGQLVFDHGLRAARELMCGCADELKSPDNSYFLAIFTAV